ncbi:MAG: hypothetical protein ACRC80_29905, partial [Waterburya sp.]
TLNNQTTTIERYLYQAGVNAPQNCVITDEVKIVNSLPIACKKLIFTLAANNYDPLDPSLQLSKIVAPIGVFGS